MSDIAINKKFILGRFDDVPILVEDLVLAAVEDPVPMLTDFLKDEDLARQIVDENNANEPVPKDVWKYFEFADPETERPMTAERIELEAEHGPITNREFLMTFRDFVDKMVKVENEINDGIVDKTYQKMYNNWFVESSDGKKESLNISTITKALYSD